MTKLNLLPYPRSVEMSGEQVTLPRNSGVILITSPVHLFEAQWIQSALREKRINWAIQTTNPTNDFVLKLQLVTDVPTQGYRLTVNPDGITVAGDKDGIFYGLCTLRQLVLEYGHHMPQVTITDHPDFPARGVMLDISRDKVPTMATLYMLVDELAALKINQLQLYTEHTFAFRQHGEVWRHASPMTAQDILELDVYCKQRHMELVPNQNSLGHMERWLKHPQYHDLAEKPEGFIPPWGGDMRSASTLDPYDDGSIKLITTIYDELLPNFSSNLFNVGCDEPWELGQGNSKERVEELGGWVYLEWLQKLHQKVTTRGKQMMFWGDIIMHHPKLVPELPKNIIVMEWGYESTHDFDGHCKVFADSGIPFYVCPGTSSWNTLVGRTDNAFGNLRNAAAAGLKHGAIGFLNTDWGDNGHWQPLSVSFAAFAYGAAVSWGYQANHDMDMAAALNRFVFRDMANVMGTLALDLGNVYKDIGPEHINGQILAYGLQASRERIETMRQMMEGGAKADVLPDNLRRVIQKIESIVQPLSDHEMSRTDADIIVHEFTHASNLLKHGAKWLLIMQGESDYSPYELLQELDELIVTQREMWLSRNRPGGLEDSIRHFDTLRSEYLKMLN